MIHRGTRTPVVVGQDRGRPRFRSASVAASGTAWTVVFSEPITTVGLTTQFAGTGSVTGAAALTYVSGAGSATYVFSSVAVMKTGETVTLAYSGTVAKDKALNLMLGFSGASVTNSSAQP
jgi:hypothetical protein